jgi:hypothetical protein
MATEELAAPEIFVSTDIETDGPIPGPHSMLSLASVAYDDAGHELQCFSRNLELLPGAEPHPATVKWWLERPDAWKAARENPATPEEVMPEYAQWLSLLPGTPIFLGYPASWDFMFVYWYLMKFTDGSPLGHSALDIRSFTMGALDRPFHLTTMKHLKKRRAGEALLTHVALDDARVQGELFFDVRRVRRRELALGQARLREK